MTQSSTTFSEESVNNITLPTLYQEQIHKTKYARWIDELGRREYWHETVDRYLDQLSRQVNKFDIDPDLWETTKQELRFNILNLKIMPSMRAMMTAGPALERDNVAGYNCAFTAIDRIEAFDEALYILCCGTGIGFSVESKYTKLLPEIPQLEKSNLTIVVEDSKIGWATALRQLIHELYNGGIPTWNTSQVRPAGSRLKTFGGRASGPGPLEDLFKYIIEIFKVAQSRQLKPLECHGIMCKIGDIVVSGGVRRSALISLSDPDDLEMRDAKSGEWWIEHPEYALANNSAAWYSKPSEDVFQQEWQALIDSHSGERGIVNIEGMQTHAFSNGRRDGSLVVGSNPCCEVSLRNMQFCNLTEIVARENDTYTTLADKVRLATILGTIQSTFTDFRYLSDEWKNNCEEERLLGVSITGIMDCPLLNDYNDLNLNDRLAYLRDITIQTNKFWSDILGINQSTSITVVKPSGTVSQLVNSASGIHPRYSKYYIRTNRGNKIDPIAQFMYMQGIPTEDDIMKPDTTMVFSFPIKSPDGAVVRDQITALDQLKLWLTYAEYWCEHKPSITVYVRDEEWDDVGKFVYPHFARMYGQILIRIYLTKGMFKRC